MKHLAIHEQFHHGVADLYKSAIPDDRVDWVFNTLRRLS